MEVERYEDTKQENMKNKLTDSARVIFWIIVIVGGFWLAFNVEESYHQRKEEELDKRIEKTCSVIEDEQPNNTDLYDSCVYSGHREFDQ